MGVAKFDRRFSATECMPVRVAWRKFHHVSVVTKRVSRDYGLG